MPHLNGRLTVPRWNGFDAFKKNRAALRLDALRLVYGDAVERSGIRNICEGLCDHLFYVTYWLASKEDTVSIDRICGRIERIAPKLADQSARLPVILGKESCLKVADGNFWSHVYVHDFCDNFPQPERTSVDEGLRLLDRLGWRQYFDDAASVVVLLDWKEDASHLESYTITALRSTIYMDHHPSRIRMAETLIHEATHNWLNLAFDAWAEPLPETPTWWSPWRGIERPVAGIVHAIAAFGFVIWFLSDARDSPHLTAEEAEYAKEQVILQARKIGLFKDSIADVVAYLENAELREFVLALFNEAVATGQTHEIR